MDDTTEVGALFTAYRDRIYGTDLSISLSVKARRQFRQCPGMHQPPALTYATSRPSASFSAKKP